MDLPPGARFGPYEIVSPIAAGGMGEVYRGRAFLTPDGRHYVYSFRRVRSDLYLAEGLH